MSAPHYRGPRELSILWQQQPAGEADRWAQVQGEILPPALVGPLLPEHQPRVQVILTEGSTSIARPAVVELVAGLQAWLDRTRWSAELPPPPAPAELLTNDDERTDCTLCGHPWGPHTPLGPDGRGSCTRCIEKYMPEQQCPGYAL